ncbi:MAG: GNAT family N-acetyltransferase [Algoriphagus sp.]|uniref:GNAT family N-acetyltransferase n=1 Tax=Algoriphagus sp. TaxID=1872435 RepID=UPI0026126D17|nr:GNAT family N-acetyltransferase [Algoriphagus sp.]MDG1277785.1 GNAT family N-acetyltransferase [Algoriphagus sp.]
MGYRILKSDVSDLPELLNMAQKAFVQAFTANNKPENVKAYLNEAFTLDQFREEYQKEGSTFFKLVSGTQIIGYTKVNLTPAQTDVHDPESLEIARLYLLDEFIGLGLGKMLLEQAIDFAKEKQKKYIWLGVWEHNPRAISFYERNGFEKFSSHPFPFGDEVQTDWLMRKLI